MSEPRPDSDQPSVFSRAAEMQSLGAEAQTSDAEALAAYLEQHYPLFEHMGGEMAADISLRQWDAVIGDDKSGRLPAGDP
jgi:hypothetical protein